MVNKIKAQVQQPMFAYRLFYREPIFDLDELDSEIVQAAFNAFRPWNISLENVKVKEDAANLAEEATTLTLFGGRITFSVTPGGCAIAVANPSWAEVDLIVNVCTAGVAAVLEASEASLDKQVASIAMHLSPQPGANSLTDLTSKFVKIDLSKLGGAPPKSFGFSVYRDDLLWVVDRSVSFDNSLFVRMDRWFNGGESLAQIARQLDSDERTVLDLLGIEVD